MFFNSTVNAGTISVMNGCSSVSSPPLRMNEAELCALSVTRAPLPPLSRTCGNPLSTRSNTTLKLPSFVNVLLSGKPSKRRIGERTSINGGISLATSGSQTFGTACDADHVASNSGACQFAMPSFEAIACQVASDLIVSLPACASNSHPPLPRETPPGPCRKTSAAMMLRPL